MVTFGFAQLDRIGHSERWTTISAAVALGGRKLTAVALGGRKLTAVALGGQKLTEARSEITK
jgi:hypothetical protein